MAKTVDITASYVGTDITTVDVYNLWPGGTRLSGPHTKTNLLNGISITGLDDSIFDFVLVDTETSASSTSKSLPGPTITEFNPTQGTVGDTIGITGSGFIGTTYVELGYKNVTSFITSSDTRMELIVPSDASDSSFLLISNPKGSAFKTGWQYTVGGTPVINPLGTFAYSVTLENVCNSQEINYSLYTQLGTSIAQAFTNNSEVYIDGAATDLAPSGFYKEIPSTTEEPVIYYVDGNSRVVETFSCNQADDGSGEDTSSGGSSDREVFEAN